MIKITGTPDARPAARAKKAAKSAPAFKPGGASEAASSSGAGDVAGAARTEMMQALISLQSDGAAGGGRKTFAAAQRILEHLDGLKVSLLDGGVAPGDVAILEDAAKIRAHADAEPGLLQIYDEIALRARVELAKLGR